MNLAVSTSNLIKKILVIENINKVPIMSCYDTK